MKEQFSEELLTWAEKVIKLCKPIAEDYYLDYYAFQKPCDLKHKTLILALNPYSRFSGPFEKVENPIESHLSSKDLLMGNKQWNGYATKSIIFKKLLKLKLIDDLDLGFNYMNYVYFSTKKFEDIKKVKEIDILSICKSLTLEFLQILKPERIIILGTSTGIDEFVSDSENLLIGNDGKRLIVKAKIDEYDAFAIPHLSGAWINDENIALIDLNLREIIENKKQSGLEIKNKMSNISRRELDLNLKELKIITTNKNYSDIFIKGLDEDNILIRINYKERTVGVRNSEGKNFTNLKHVEFYKKFFTKIHKENQSSWAFEKKFPSHFFADYKELSDEIFNLKSAIQLIAK